MQKEKKMQITRHKLTADWLSYCRLVTFTITHQRSHRPGPHLQSNRFKSSEIQVCCTLLQKFWLCCHLTVNVALGRGHYKYKVVYSDNASINRARGGDRTHQLSRFKPEGEILNQCVWQHSSNEGMCSSIQQNQCQGLLDFLLICHISVDVQRKFLTVKQALQQLTSILYSCIFFFTTTHTHKYAELKVQKQQMWMHHWTDESLLHIQKQAHAFFFWPTIQQ